MFLSVILVGLFIVFLPQIQALRAPNFPQIKISSIFIETPPPPALHPHPFILDIIFNDRITIDDSNTMNLGANAQISSCEQSFSQKEMLIWHYDQEMQTLKFLNKNVELNCCGKLFISISKNEETNTYFINEIDKHEIGRCLCNCIYDIKIDLPNIAEKCFNLKVNRHITDEGTRSIIWEGELNLQQGSGKVLIK